MMRIEEKYDISVNEEKIANIIGRIQERATELRDKEVFRKIFGLIDLTSLDVTDNQTKISALVDKINMFPDRFKDLPNVAAICVYPAFLPLLNEELRASGVSKAVVGASFPSSQTFRSVKLKEMEAIMEHRADEIDIVMPVGRFLDKDYDFVYEEIREIKDRIQSVKLKVILETGSLLNLKNIKLASFLCLEAGADFIKTSTGKTNVGATPEAMFVMCEAIKDFHVINRKMAGIKPAGGVSDATTAILYYLIVHEVLGNQWLSPSLFRIGASRLANKLLGENFF